MAGPGANEARITVEAGSARFVSRAPIAKGPITADTLIEAMPKLAATMTEQLIRVKKREEKR